MILQIRTYSNICQ